MLTGALSPPQKHNELYQPPYPLLTVVAVALSLFHLHIINGPRIRVHSFPPNDIRPVTPLRLHQTWYSITTVLPSADHSRLLSSMARATRWVPATIRPDRRWRGGAARLGHDADGHRHIQRGVNEDHNACSRFGRRGELWHGGEIKSYRLR